MHADCGSPGSPGALPGAALKAPAFAIAITLIAIAAALCWPQASHAVSDTGSYAYELVSPVEKNGGVAGSVGREASYSLASADGDTIMYYTSSPVGQEAPRGFQRFHVGRRTPEGWKATPVVEGPDPDMVLSPLAHDPAQPTISQDRVHLAWVSRSYGPPLPFLSPWTESPSGLYRAAAGGPPQWVSQPTIDDPYPALDTGFSQSEFRVGLGGNPDLSVLYFSMQGRLTPEDSVRASDPSTWGLYRWEKGELTNAALLPDGSLHPGGAIAVGQANATDEWRGLAARNPVSADGRRLFFASPTPTVTQSEPPQLYVRIDGERTMLISRDERTGEPAPTGITGNNSLQRVDAHATPDGRYVFFTSRDQLTDDAPEDAAAKLYRFDVDEEELIFAASPINPIHEAAIPVAGVTADGARAMIIRDGQMEIWSEDGIHTVGPTGWAPYPVRANRDGTVWAFISRQAHDPNYPVTPGTAQIYRYEIGDPAPTCITCPPGVDAPQHNQWQSWFLDSIDHARGVSDDLSQVFFDTTEAFVPGDTNGVRDVYRWQDGKYELISTGRDSDPSFYLDNSADGSTVFFATAEGIVYEDIDGSYDVYAARIGGGFPEQATPRSCVGDECQGAAHPSPSAPSIGSVVLGDGNVVRRQSSARTSVKVSRPRRVAGVAAALRVRVTGAGRIAVRGPFLRSNARAVNKAGAYSLRLALKPRARRALRAKGRLRVRARVVFRAENGRTTGKVIPVTFLAKAGHSKTRKGGR